MIIEDLKEILKNVKPNANLDNITPETTLAGDLGIDSISMIMLALAIENKFGIQMDSSVRFTKVGEVVEYLEKVLKNK